MYTVAVYAVDPRKVEIRAIGPGLIPSLNRSTDGACDDGEEKGLVSSPFMKNLVAKGVDLGLVEGFVSSDVLVPRWILCDKSTLANNVSPLS